MMFYKKGIGRVSKFLDQSQNHEKMDKSKRGGPAEAKKAAIADEALVNQSTAQAAVEVMVWESHPSHA
jgi:hypothetical protein